MCRIQVRFGEKAADDRLKFAVIASVSEGKWVFCRHEGRTTWEVPGGHREPGESIQQAARRELWEETGAKVYTLEPVCVYTVDDGEKVTHGMLYFAQIERFGPLPAMEIKEVALMDRLPEEWTYPAIQPLLIQKVIDSGLVKWE